jgi:hypothetical protein
MNERDSGGDALRKRFKALCFKDCPPSVLKDRNLPDGVTSLKLYVIEFVRNYLKSEQLSRKERENLRASLANLEHKAAILDVPGREYIGEVLALAQDVLRDT